MQSGRVVALSLLLLLVAGCADPRQPASRLVEVGRMGLEMFPAERPVAYTTLWHEEVHSETPRPVQDWFILENEWEPRDVPLTYHGLQPVYDEWGREILAHVFRYQPMELVITDIEFLNGFSDVRITARFEPGHVEYAFDAATAKLVGYTDLKHQVHGFTDYRWPSPLVGGYDGDLLLAMAYQFLGGDLEAPLADPFGTITLDDTTEKPLGGDCTPYEYEFEPAPWFEEWVGADDPMPITPDDDQLHLVCLQQEGHPLWMYSGNTTDYLAVTRVGDAMPTVGLSGDPLPPRPVERREFEPLDVLLGLAQDVRVPPTGYPGDWADQVRPIISAIGTNPDYLQWQMERERLFVTDLTVAIPFFGSQLIPLLPVDPVRFEETSFVMVADGQDAYYSLVDSHYGDAEDPDLHVSRQGFALDDYPVREETTVASGDVQVAWEGQLPVEPDLLLFSGPGQLSADYPPEFVDYLEPFLTTWFGMEHCYVEEVGGRFGTFSAHNGQMYILAGQTSTVNGCGVGIEGSDGVLRFRSAGHDLWVRPATLDEPAVLIFPETGEAHILGRPLAAAA